MAVQVWPEALKITRITPSVVRPKTSEATPLTQVEYYDASPYSKFQVDIEFRAKRETSQRLVSQAWAALAQAETDGIRVPFWTPVTAKVTGVIQATGSNRTLNLTKVGGGSAKAAINGGAGFRRGQIFSLIHNNENYCYTVAEDQVDETVKVTSRLRGGAITSAVTLAIAPPYIEGRLTTTPEMPMGADMFVKYQITLKERK